MARAEGIDPEFEHVRMKDVMEESKEQVDAIIRRVVETGADTSSLTVVVMHPSSILFEDAIAQGTIAPTDGARAVLMKRSTVSEILRVCFTEQSIAEAFDLFPADSIPTVYLAGSAVQTTLTRRTLVSPAVKEAFREGSDGEFYMTARGFLWMLYNADPADVKPGAPRERIELFKETAQLAYERERRLENPRPLDVFLFEEFGGKQIEAAMKRGDIGRATKIPFEPSERVIGLN